MATKTTTTKVTPDVTATTNGTKPAARASLLSLRNEVNQYVFEREDVVDGILVAILAKKHVVQIGPKGCAKSFTCNLIASAFTGLKYGSFLLHQHTPPEELLGPIDIPLLRQGTLKRNIQGRLPDVHLANIEEIFNAPDSLFGSLHTISNERKFYNPDEQDCPLVTIVGSANKLPGETAEAFFDRIHLRYPVDYLQNPDLKRKAMLNQAMGIKPVINSQISLTELQQMHIEVEQVQFPELIIDALLKLEVELAALNVFISDRRRNDMIDILKAYAYLQGEAAVAEEHLNILTYCLWSDPRQVGAINSQVIKIGSPVAAKATEILDAAKQEYRTIGNPPSDEAEAAQWQVTASGVTRKLKGMSTDLQDLLTNTPGASATAIKKVNQAMKEIDKMKQDIFDKIKDLLQQP